MPRIVEDLRTRTFLDKAAGIHDTDAIAEPANDSEVVRDEEHSGVALLSQHSHQVEHLSLNSCVEAGCGLIEDQECRVASQCHCNHHALLHAAGQLKREPIHHAGGISDAYSLQGLEGQRRSLLLVVTEQRETLDDLPTDAQRRVESLRRILIDHRRLAGSELLQFIVGHRGEIAPADAHMPANNLAVAGQVAQSGVGGSRFTAAGLAD